MQLEPLLRSRAPHYSRSQSPSSFRTAPMARSVSIIDYKVRQADFFLERLEECGYDFFAAQCYSDAFASACRSITFSIQAVCKQLPDFDGWYPDEQARMKADPLCVFFNSYRTANIHVGGTPVLAGEMKNGEARFFFRPSPDVPRCQSLMSSMPAGPTSKASLIWSSDCMSGFQPIWTIDGTTQRSISAPADCRWKTR